MAMLHSKKDKIFRSFEAEKFSRFLSAYQYPKQQNTNKKRQKKKAVCMV